MPNALAVHHRLRPVGPLVPGSCALLLASALAAPLTADTEHYGCGANPDGSLVVVAGDAVLGETLVIGVDNPLGTQAPGSIAALYLAAAPDPAFPCGTPAFGLSMSGPGVPGELLVDLSPSSLVQLAILGPWTGPGVPATVALAVPTKPSLVGLSVYAQGVIVDVTGTGSVVTGATEGLRLTVEDACDAEAPCLDVLAFERRAYAESRAFDYEYDDGESDLDVDATAVATWSGSAHVDHDDYYGVPIGSADAQHHSRLGVRTITCDFDVAASTEGNLFSEDALGESELGVDFDLPFRARFLMTVDARVTDGYDEATAILRRGSTAVLSVGAFQGNDAAGSAQGWLQPGSYRLEARAAAMAYGSSSFSQSHTAGLDLELVLFGPADFDLDGDVDQDDLNDFLVEHGAGSPDADFDGDGDTDGDDASGFAAAWNAAQGS